MNNSNNNNNNNPPANLGVSALMNQRDDEEMQSIQTQAQQQHNVPSSPGPNRVLQRPPSSNHASPVGPGFVFQPNTRPPLRNSTPHGQSRSLSRNDRCTPGERAASAGSNLDAITHADTIQAGLRNAFDNGTPVLDHRNTSMDNIVFITNPHMGEPYLTPAFDFPHHLFDMIMTGRLVQGPECAEVCNLLNSPLSAINIPRLTAYLHDHVETVWGVAILSFLVAEKSRSENVERAGYYYYRANQAMPMWSKPWRGHCKLEDECGRRHAAVRVVHQALQWHPYDEDLLLLALKIYEHVGLSDELRVISKQRVFAPAPDGEDTVCTAKTRRQFALLHQRLGDVEEARQRFKQITDEVPSHVVVFLDAYHLEENNGDLASCQAVLDRGLKVKKGDIHLWERQLRLTERAVATTLFASEPEAAVATMDEIISRALKLVPRDSLFIIHMEAAFSFARLGDSDRSQSHLFQSVKTSPESQRWKVYAQAAELMFGIGSYDSVEMMNYRSLGLAGNSGAKVLLQMARMCEFQTKDYSKTDNILAYAEEHFPMDWLVSLERVLAAARCDRPSQVQLANDAVQRHANNGRLWCTLIWLSHYNAAEQHTCTDAPWEVPIQHLVAAIKEAPRSGEVWTEAARLSMNPFSPRYNLNAAETFLHIALMLTPQYGDAFIEYIRLQLIGGRNISEAVTYLCNLPRPLYGPLWHYCTMHPLKSVREVVEDAVVMVRNELAVLQPCYDVANQNSQMGSASISPSSTLQDVRPTLFTSALAVFSEQFTHATDTPDALRYRLIFAESMAKKDS